MIPLSSPNIRSGNELSYVQDALNRNWISGTGEYVRLFERELARRVGRNHCTAVANGTVALEVALKSLGIGPGDEVIVPALTFVSPAAAVKSVGAQPVFADVSFRSWCIDPESVARVMTEKTKAIIAVDLLGSPADFSHLNFTGIPVIEDAAQGHGASYGSRPCGSHGVISTFSFHANKAITTGEGGAVLTDNPQLADKIFLLSNHGMRPQNPYFHEVVGTNARMTNLTAAIGLGQVERWLEHVQARNAIREKYENALGSSVEYQPRRKAGSSTCLMVACSENRDKILKNLRQAGVDARPIWHALCDLPIYQDACRLPDYPVARLVARLAFFLPTYEGLYDEDIRYIAKIILSC